MNSIFVSGLSVSEFRGIKRLSDLEFSSFNVLVGRNNSCKTTLLEALWLLPAPYYPPNVGFKGASSRLKLLENKHNSLKNLIYFYSGKAKIEYLIGDICEAKLEIEDSPNAKKCEFECFERKGCYGDRIGVYHSKLSEIYPKHSSENFQNLVFMVPSDTNFLRNIDESLKKLADYIVKKKAHVSIPKKLSKYVSDDFTEIYLDTLKLRKEMPDGTPYYVRLSDLGEGLKKAVKLMLVIEAVEPKLILWDDFETFAHPSLVKFLLRWLAEKECQVVLSTHSLDVIYELVELIDYRDDARLIQLKKDKEDVLLTESLTLEELEDLLAANVDPRKTVDLLCL